ncbi:MAG: EAL domain-containing protein [Pseudomonadota bacterium]
MILQSIETQGMWIRAVAFTLLVFLIGFSVTVNAYIAPDHQLHLHPRESGSQVLGHHVQVIMDPTKELSIDDVTTKTLPWQTLGARTLNLGFMPASVWVKIRLANDNSEKITRYLEIANSNLRVVNLYLFDKVGQPISFLEGLKFPVADRQIPHRNAIFILDLDGYEMQDVFLKVHSQSSTRIPIQLWRPDAWTVNDQKHALIEGIYFGLLIALALYNLFSGVLLSEKRYLYYVGYVVSLIVFFAGYSGYISQYLPIISFEQSGLIIFYAAISSLLFSLLFAHHFLELEKQRKKLSIMVITLFSVIAGFGVYRYFIDTSHLWIYWQILFVLTSVVFFLLLVAGIVCWRNQNKQASYFTFAFGFLFVGSVWFVLTKFGLFPSLLITEYAFQMGSAIEVIILAFAISQRANTERQSSLLVQRRVIAEIQSREQAEYELLVRSTHDEITGCPNEKLLVERLRDIADESPNVFVFMVLKLYGLEEITNTLGFETSDKLLFRAARRFSNYLTNLDEVLIIDPDSERLNNIVRGQGHYFVVVYRDHSGSQLEKIVHHLHRCLTYPFEYNGMTLDLQLFVGLSRYPNHGADVNVLVRRASIAAEIARNNEKPSIEYSVQMEPYSHRRLMLLSDLREAVKTSQLYLVYQPQVYMKSGEVAGFEALARWNHPLQGLISPVEFIALAEKTGMIGVVTDWLIETALKDLQYLISKGYPLRVSINISGRSFSEVDLATRILKRLEEKNIPPHLLGIEVTETVVVKKVSTAMVILHALHEKGVHISIDDFGTGYSSLSYLKSLPVNAIKLDRSFIQELEEGSDDESIVITAIDLGHRLGLEVVCEGLEDTSTLNILQKTDLDLLQGYLVAVPMTLEALMSWLIRVEEISGFVEPRPMPSILNASTRFSAIQIGMIPPLLIEKK